MISRDLLPEPPKRPFTARETTSSKTIFCRLLRNCVRLTCNLSLRIRFAPAKRERAVGYSDRYRLKNPKNLDIQVLVRDV